MQNYDEKIIGIVSSLAIEEKAISKLITAQQNSLNQYIDNYNHQRISSSQLICLFKSQLVMLDNLIMKEWLILNHIRVINDLYEN